MEIIIGMLVGSRVRQKKYKETLQDLLQKKFCIQEQRISFDYLFYPSLEILYDAMVRGNERVDILVLPAGTGSFAFASQLRDLDRSCLILYPAKDMELVLQAFSSMPIAYVPVNQGTYSLEQEILRAAEYVRKAKSQIVFETKSRILPYALSEIDYIESQYRMVHIVKSNKKTDTITARLDDVQTRLPCSFYRCHQSYLVNMDHISFIDRSVREVHFYSGQCVPSSKKLFSDFLEVFKCYRSGGDADAGLS